MPVHLRGTRRVNLASVVIAACFAAIVAGSGTTAHAAFDVSTFTDASQLDFSGDFVYAGALGDVSGALLPVTIGDATFTGLDALWTGPATSSFGSFGPGPDNAKLNIVLDGLRFHSDGNGPIGELPVVVGNTYKLQLLMLYFDRARSNLVTIEGVDQTPTFDTVASTNVGTVSTFTYTATDPILNIHIKGFPGSSAFGQPILNAFTLELIPIPEPSTAIMAALSALGIFAMRRKMRVEPASE